MISNMEQTLRKMYEDAKDEGKIAGIAEGEKDGIAKGKEEIVKNMLGRNMDEMLISKIRELKKELKH